MPNRASVRQDSGPGQAARLGQHRVGRQPHVVEHQLAGDRRPQRHLLLDLGRREPRGVRRDDEAADRAVLAVLDGARPDHRDVGDRAVGDPHLGAGRAPSRRRRAARGCACRPGRSRSRARSARSSRSPRRSPSAAATRPSARPTRASRSRTSPAIPGPTRSSAARSRRPRAPGRPGRTPSRWCRRSRTRSGASRAGRACRTRGRGRAPARRPRSYHPAISGRSRSSTKRADGVADRALLVADERVEVEQGERVGRCHEAIIAGAGRSRRLQVEGPAVWPMTTGCSCALRVARLTATGSGVGLDQLLQVRQVRPDRPRLGALHERVAQLAEDPAEPRLRLDPVDEERAPAVG